MKRSLAHIAVCILLTACGGGLDQDATTPDTPSTTTMHVVESGSLPTAIPVGLTLQNRFASAPTQSALAAVGMNNAAWTVGGHAVLYDADYTLEEAVAVTDDEIRAQLVGYLQHNPELTASGALAIFDLEAPEHLRSLRLHDEAERRVIVEEFKRRLHIASELLPHNPIGLYGAVVIPNGVGNDNEAVAQTQSAYVEAGQWGLYDEVDTVVTVVYQRFGFGPESLDQKPFELLARYTNASIAMAQVLRTRSGTAIPITALMGFSVGAGDDHSLDAGDPVSVSALRSQLRTICANSAVTTIAFWNGSDVGGDIDVAATLTAVNPASLAECQL